MSVNPQIVTIRGRLSWPNFTLEQALQQNKNSQFPKKDEDVRPNFNLLLEQPQADKLVEHMKNVFLPWVEAQGKIGEKSGLKAAHVKKLAKILDEADWETEGVMGLIYPVHEKSQDLAPETVASVKVNGLKGRDLDQKAVVRSEEELANPTADIVIPERGLILPVADTNLELYPGSMVAAQLDLFAYTAAGNPGVTASTQAAIFVGHAERFGGGAPLDEDAVFMDLDD